MKHLFVIGNGFDCYAHLLPTKYSDFRSYIISRYPSASEYDDLIPDSTMMPDGDEVMDMEDVAGFITRIIDSCDADLWSNLEYYLGSSIFDVLHYDLDEVSLDGTDKEMMRAIYNNEDHSSKMKQAFIFIKDLFYDWVQSKLSRLNYSGIVKEQIADVLNAGDAFLSFNYTETLEKAYGINPDCVCHIHGKVGDPTEMICFGHGDIDNVPEWSDSLGADVNLSELKRELQKDTHKALFQHIDFFEKMRNVESIHSFGFSFSQVDMIYVETIANHVDLSKAIWYLNTFDSTDTCKRRSLEKLGFHVEVDKRW